MLRHMSHPVDCVCGSVKCLHCHLHASLHMISVQLQRAMQPRQATLDFTIFCVDEQQLMTWSYV